MYGEDFALRLTQLRTQKGVSARDMSLSLGQNPAYINNIENGKALPSMTAFFYICEYLGIAPKDFFDTAVKTPERVNHIIDNVKRLTPSQMECVCRVIDEFAKR